MKKCILVWQVPVIEGEPYNPVEYAVHVRKAKKFAEALNRYFAEKNMDYNCVLDKSACSLDEIFSPQYQAVLFAPEAKTRQWLYKKEVHAQALHVRAHAAQAGGQGRFQHIAGLAGVLADEDAGAVAGAARQDSSSAAADLHGHLTGQVRARHTADAIRSKIFSHNQYLHILKHIPSPSYSWLSL